MTTGPQKVAVFGATGFIGNKLCGLLRQNDCWEVTAFSSKNCNLLDSTTLRNVIGSLGENTTIVFCAGIGRLQDDSWPAMLANIEMVHNVASCAAVRGLRGFLFLSSVDVYGLPPKSLPLDESVPTAPNSYYGLAKLISEHLLRLQLAARCPVTVLRLPGIYGPGDNGQSVIGKLARRVLCCEVIELQGGGSVLRDYVEVTDLCRIIECLLQQSAGGLFNVATGHSISVRNIIIQLASAAHVTPRLHIVPDTEGRGHDLVFDVVALKAVCPQLVVKPLEQGLVEYVRALTTSQ